jgi:hypothetical protein
MQLFEISSVINLPSRVFSSVTSYLPMHWLKKPLEILQASCDRTFIGNLTAFSMIGLRLIQLLSSIDDDALHDTFLKYTQSIDRF